MASGAYQTSTSVESSAGRPSTGRYCENPVSRAARRHTGSASPPFVFSPTPQRGKRAASRLARALEGGAGAGAALSGAEREASMAGDYMWDAEGGKREN